MATFKERLTGLVPKGIGLSPKVFFAGLICVGLFLTLSLMAIFYYRGGDEHPVISRHGPQLLQPTQGGLEPEEAIRHLNENKNGVLLQDKKAGVKNKIDEQVIRQNNAMTSSSADQIAPLGSPAGSSGLQPNSSIQVINNYRGPSESSESSASPVTTDAHLQTMSDNPASQDYQAQNMQDEKIAFLQAEGKANKNFYLTSARHKEEEETT